MFHAYIVRYMPATDTKGARLSVTCGDTGARKTVSYDYGADNPMRAALASTFGVTSAEYVGKAAPNASIYIIRSGSDASV